ncbi:transporter substrate-binding domain-containing protein [Andreprevotia sp. IGB-42]|uniref:transporter substrate-binding domain-containing protein n=1 Tax=Andreprevotia sp. IGB-42 TaxID=2497473 RepID=UPI0013580B9C|nr:transporter substrate-binding domain-containing protein [Andreprevotia sp. IGB-42]
MRLPLVLLMLQGTTCAAADAPLLLTFIDKPPYYQLNAGNKPGGFLLEHALRVLDKAGIRARAELRPNLRALLEIEHPTEPACSVGWFKTAERERYGRFSDALFRDPPVMLATRSDALARFKPYGSAAALLAEPALTPGTIMGYGYGPYLDELLRVRGTRVDNTAQTMQQNLAKAGYGRVDYVLVDQAEFSWWRKQPGLRNLALAGINLPDIPAGNTRYLLCNKLVPDAMLQRINQAIAALPKPVAPGN